MHSKKQSDLHTVVRPSNTKTILKQVKVMHDKMESNQEKTSSFWKKYPAQFQKHCNDFWAEWKPGGRKWQKELGERGKKDKPQTHLS